MKNTIEMLEQHSAWVKDMTGDAVPIDTDSFVLAIDDAVRKLKAADAVIAAITENHYCQKCVTHHKISDALAAYRA